MSYYAKLQVVPTIATTTDLTPNLFPEIAAYGTLAADHVLISTGIAVTSSGATVAIPSWFVPEFIVIKNSGLTYALYVSWTGVDEAGGDTTCETKVPAGAILVIPHFKTGTDIGLDCATNQTTTADVYGSGA